MQHRGSSNAGTATRAGTTKWRLLGCPALGPAFPAALVQRSNLEHRGVDGIGHGRVCDGAVDPRAFTSGRFADCNCTSGRGLRPAGGGPGTRPTVASSCFRLRPSFSFALLGWHWWPWLAACRPLPCWSSRSPSGQRPHFPHLHGGPLWATSSPNGCCQEHSAWTVFNGTSARSWGHCRRLPAGHDRCRWDVLGGGRPHERCRRLPARLAGPAPSRLSTPGEGASEKILGAVTAGIRYLANAPHSR